MRVYIAFFLSLLIGTDLKAQLPDNYSVFNINGYAQGTTYNIKYYAADSIKKNDVDSILHAIDMSMSVYNSKSLISKFNDYSTKKIKMDKHMQNVIEESIRVNSLTNGYFDITVMPLVNLWGFGTKGYVNSPSQKEIDDAKSLVGMHFVRSKGNSLIKKKQGVSIDVNGIAQGYSVDVLYDYFLSQNISNFLIELGGEIRSHGIKPMGDFIVEIQRPFQEKEKSSYKIKLKNKAITTSGNYEKSVKIDGKLVSHHINPKTGLPISNNTLSVTVIANTAMMADALDNYLMFVSPQAAIDFVEKQKDVEVFVVYYHNNSLKELQSSGFNNYIYN